MQPLTVWEPVRDVIIITTVCCFSHQRCLSAFLSHIFLSLPFLFPLLLPVFSYPKTSDSLRLKSQAQISPELPSMDL